MDNLASESFVDEQQFFPSNFCYWFRDKSKLNLHSRKESSRVACNDIGRWPQRNINLRNYNSTEKKTVFYAKGLRIVEDLKFFAKRIIFPPTFLQHTKDFMVEVFILFTCFVNWKSSIRTFLFKLFWRVWTFWKKVLSFFT